MTDPGRPPSRTRREILAGLGIGAAAWTAPQVISVTRAGAMTEYSIVINAIDCTRFDVGPPVPFTWTCSGNVPADPDDMTEGGTISISTAGCFPVSTTSPATPRGDGQCFAGSDPGPFTEPGAITGPSVFFPNLTSPSSCFYEFIYLTVQCSS